MPAHSNQLLAAPAPALPAVSVSANSASVTEGNRGSASLTFTISLDTALTTDQSVSWTVAGIGLDAASDDDFTSALSGHVDFFAGQTTKTVTVTIAADSIWEEDEDFALTLSTPSSGIMLGTFEAIATIVNDDPFVDDHPNTIGGNERLVVNGDAAAGMIDYGDDSDMFRLDVIAGKEYTLSMEATDSLDCYLEIYDADGNLVAGNNDATSGDTNAALTFTALETTTLYVAAWSFSSSETGGYTLSASTGERANIIEGSRYGDRVTGSTFDDTITGGNGADRLFGNLGDDLIYGDEGRDRINGGAGNDVISGGTGRDVFFFTGAFGHDQITDFEDGTDRINLAGTDIGSWRELSDGHIVETADGVRISIDGNSILLLGITLAEVSREDFVF